MISKAEFKQRRRLLMELAERACMSLGEHPNSFAIVVPAAPVKARNLDSFYAYRQDSDLVYLTGFLEPDAVLVLIPGRAAGQSILFCRERSPERERWDGEILGPERAPAKLGLDDAFPITDIDDILPNLIDGKPRLYFHFGRDAEFDMQVLNWINRLRTQRKHGARPPESIIALGHLLGDLRLFKSKAELELLQRAADIAARAHVRAMRATAPGVNENQLEAELLYGFRTEGAVCAYEPTVATGANACVFHYRGNRARLNAGELVLIDAGCEVDCYASDITRTFPVDGAFSALQAELYDIVYAAQNAAISVCRAGASWADVHNAARLEIIRGLLDVKLVKGDIQSVLRDQSYRRYFPHKTGHWLGLDVHDVGDYQIDGHSRLLEAGMVLTIEPGIYIAADDAQAPKAWRGLGIRIEDEIAVESKGPRLLTQAAPRARADIEAFMQSGALEWRATHMPAANDELETPLSQIGGGNGIAG